jgi:hypothetical protein
MKVDDSKYLWVGEFINKSWCSHTMVYDLSIKRVLSHATIGMNPKTPCKVKWNLIQKITYWMVALLRNIQKRQAYRNGNPGARSGNSDINGYVRSFAGDGEMS